MALVINRRDGESLILHTKDGPVRVTVKCTRWTTFIIEAPLSVRISRSELEGEPPPRLKRRQK